MPRYLVSLFRPQGFDHAAKLTPDVRKAIDQVNADMVAAGVRFFVGGLRSPTLAKSVQLGTAGEMTVADGPYQPGASFIDGFWVLECATIDEALSWARKAASACQGDVEVRPFH